MPDVREEFEAWYTGNLDQNLEATLRDEDGRPFYIHAPTRDAWKAWQASRAARKVELPEQLPPAIEVAGKMVHTAKDAKWNACLERVTEALQQAGIEVK